MPSIEKKEISPGHVQLTLSITREDILPAIQSELKKYRQKATIKGFRQGQAPLSYIKNLFGKSIFYEKLMALVNETLERELQGIPRMIGDILPVENTENRLSYNGIDNLQDVYSFDFEYGYVPEFQLQLFNGSLTYEKFEVEGFDELARKDYDQFLLRITDEYFPDSDIREKDLLTIEARESGTDFQTVFKVLVDNIASGDLKSQILGMKKGDVFACNIRDFEKFNNEKMFRKYILNLDDNDPRQVGDRFEGKIVTVSRQLQVPPTPEQIEQYFGAGIRSEEEALRFIHDDYASMYRKTARFLSYPEVREKICVANPIPLPEDFLRKFLEKNAQNEQALTDETLEVFARELQWRTIVSSIKQQNNFEAPESEIRQRTLQYVSQRIGFKIPDYMSDQVLPNIIQREPKLLDNIRQEIETEMVFDYLMDNMTPHVTVISPDELKERMKMLNKNNEKSTNPVHLNDHSAVAAEQTSEP